MRFTRQQTYALVALAFGFGLVILVGIAAFLFLLGGDGNVITVTATPDNVPDVVSLALADLQIRYNTEISLADLATYDWYTQRFADTSLGCPQPNQTYNPVEIDSYIIMMVYQNTIHEYHIGVDGQPLVYCEGLTGGVPTPTLDPFVPTPTATITS